MYIIQIVFFFYTSRHKYYQYLQIANEGDIRPFVRFIADCTEKTLDLYLWATSDLPQQIPMLERTEHTLANIDKLLTPTTSAGSSDASAPATTSTPSPSSSKDSSNNLEEDFFESGSGEISQQRLIALFIFQMILRRFIKITVIIFLFNKPPQICK